MSEMVDRVALAIMKANDLGHGKLPLGGPEAEAAYRKLALAAIKAMRKPTAEMLEAGPAEPYMDSHVWGQMIDAALK